MEHKSLKKSIAPDAELDCIGLYCPIPVTKTRQEIDKLQVGQILKVEADDPAADEDIHRWAKRTGHEILIFETEGTVMAFYIRKVK